MLGPSLHLSIGQLDGDHVRPAWIAHQQASADLRHSRGIAKQRLALVVRAVQEEIQCRRLIKLRQEVQQIAVDKNARTRLATAEDDRLVPEPMLLRRGRAAGEKVRKRENEKEKERSAVNYESELIDSSCQLSDRP